MNSTASAGPGRIRDLNRKAVLNEIRQHGPLSRSELINRLELSPAGVSSIVKELMVDGLLRSKSDQADFSQAKRGRPQSPLELNPAASYALGIRLQPIGDTLNIQMSWIDYSGQMTLLKKSLVCRPTKLADITTAIKTALIKLEKTVPDEDKIIGAIVATPGVIHQHEVILAPSLHYIEGDAFGSQLIQLRNYPTKIANDVNLATLSELHTQPRLRHKNFAYLYIGSGVGAGIGLQGKIHASNGWAGEIGHLKIAHNQKTGASFEKLLATNQFLATELNKIGLPSDALDELADSEHRLAKDLVSNYAHILHEMIQVLNAVLGLDEVIIDFPSQTLLSRLLPIIDQLIQQQPLKVTLSQPVSQTNTAVQGAAINALYKFSNLVEQRKNNRASKF